LWYLLVFWEVTHTNIAKMPILGFLMGCLYGLLNDGRKERKGDLTYEKNLAIFINSDFECNRFVGTGYA
jgi:hypothetical protein